MITEAEIKKNTQGSKLCVVQLSRRTYKKSFDGVIQRNYECVPTERSESFGTSIAPLRNAIPLVLSFEAGADQIASFETPKHLESLLGCETCSELRFGSNTLSKAGTQHISRPHVEDIPVFLSTQDSLLTPSKIDFRWSNRAHANVQH